MYTLKKGQLVMTDMGLSWYDRIENGEHLVNPVTWEKDHLSPHFSVTKATRTEVESYLKEKGWYSIQDGNIWNNLKNIYSVAMMVDNYAVSGVLLSEHFDTAPEQLREAITMAKLLNATK